MEIGDTVTVVGGGPIGLMFVQVAKATGCNVISVVKRDSQAAAAKRMGAHEVVQITQVKDPVEAVRMLSPDKRGSDVAIEAVGRPEAWEWAIDMVRKGGTVNFFGGCASGTKVQLDTNRLHYSEITLKATFHHTPETVRKAFALIAEPADAEFVLKSTKNCHGFYGASSMERLPVEVALTEQTRRFKSIARR